MKMTDDQVQQAVAQDDPLMVSWKAYQQTDAFANSKKWAAHEQHIMGSLWAVFENGFRAGENSAYRAKASFPKFTFIPNYKGHNSGLFNRGPNWWQITFPPSRKTYRCALIYYWNAR
jgi:hypothetical protein